MIVPTLALLLAAAPPAAADYVMSLSGVAVGRVGLERSEVAGGEELRYRSEAWVRRGPVLTRNSAAATARLDAGGAILTLTSERREGGVLVESVEGRREGGRLRVVVRQAGADARVELAPEGALPSSLAFAALRRAGGCLDVVDETSGRVGRACATRTSPDLAGTLLGEPFEAELEGTWPRRLALPGQSAVFQRVAAPPTAFDPPDLYGAGVPAVGLAKRVRAGPMRAVLHAGAPANLPQSASQSAEASPHGARVTWAAAAPQAAEPLRPFRAAGGALDAAAREGMAGAANRWSAAAALAAFVDARIADKRPGDRERSPEAVYAGRRGSCVAHAELFLALARRAGVPARLAVGLVAAEGRFWGHAWAQVEIAGAWYDVDPTEGGPAQAPRILLAAGDAARGQAGAALLARAPAMQVEVVP